jgi:hypothetical protein
VKISSVYLDTLGKIRWGGGGGRNVKKKKKKANLKKKFKTNAHKKTPKLWAIY